MFGLYWKLFDQSWWELIKLAMPPLVDGQKIDHKQTDMVVLALCWPLACRCRWVVGSPMLGVYIYTL